MKIATSFHDQATQFFSLPGSAASYIFYLNIIDSSLE